MSNNKLAYLDEKSIVKSIFIMSLPVILGNMAMVIYNLTDAFFVGKLNDVSQLAASSFTYPLMMIIASIGAIMGIGGATFLSRSLGEGRIDLAENARSKSLVYVFIIGLFIALISQFFMNGITKLLGASGEAFQYTKDYASIILLASPIIMINTVSLDTIRAEGNARLAMIGMMIGMGVNIILDPIFIFSFGLGVKGAAIATLLGNLCGLIFSLLCYKYKTFIKFKIRRAFVRDKILFKMVKVGIPAGINIILISVSMIVTNNYADKYGEAVVAGMGLALRNHSIVIQLLLGFSMGAQPLIAYTYGKRDFLKVKKQVFTTMSIITLFSTVFSVFFIIFAEQLIGIFNTNPDVVYNGARGLRALLISKPLTGIFMVTMSSIQAMGKGFIPFVLSISRQLILFMISISILDRLFGYEGFVYAQAISDYIMIIVSGFVIVHVLNKINRQSACL